MSIPFSYALLPALSIQFIGALLYFVLFPNGAVAQSIYTITKVLLIVWPLLWLRYINVPFVLKPNKHAMILGLLSGLVGAGVILDVFFLFYDYFVQQYSLLIIEKITAVGLTDPRIFILFAVFLSLIHSLLEEYYWRWFVFTGLQTKMKPLLAMIVGSFAFASHHYIILSQFFPLPLTLVFGTFVGLGGAWWCYVYKKTGTLFGAWVSHALIDMAIMTVGYILIF